MNHRKNILPAVLLVIALALVGMGKASAAVTITGATGGDHLSADTAANASSPLWTTLGAITIAEGANGDFAAGTNVTLVLSAPAGFEFNTAVTPNITVTAGTDITSATVAVTDSATITLTLTVSDTASADTLTVGSTIGIQVRPTAGAPLATGKHIYSPNAGGGTALITGIIPSSDGSSGSDFGQVAEVVGAPAIVQVETAADGSGALLPTQSVVAGSSITAYAVARDTFGNFLDNVATDAGGWALTNANGGVASGDLVPAGDRKSAVFTGHLVGSANIAAVSGSLTSTNSGLLTVIPGAANQLAIATQPSATTIVGMPLLQQPVIRIEDQYGNLRGDDTLTVTAARNGGTGTLQGTVSMAAVGGVVTYTNLAPSAVSDITITFSSGSLILATSQTIAVGPGPFSQLQLLLPGESAAPGTTTGKTGTPTAQTAGTAFVVTVRAVDANWNLVSTNDTVAITSSDANATFPASAPLVAGTGSLSLTNRTAGTWTMTASDVTAPSITANTSPSFTVNASVFVALQLLVPGETAAPGTSTGKAGAPIAQNTDNAVTVTVNAVDANWNRVTTAGDTVAITSTDPNATLPANAALSSGMQTFSVKFNTAGTRTITTTDTSDGTKTASISPSLAVHAGAFAQLQILLPGETGVPGTPGGKTGGPTVQTAGIGYAVTVNAADAAFNLVNTNDTVQVTSSDLHAGLPNAAALSGGSATLNVTNRTVGSWTIAAGDVTDPGITAATSSAVTVTAGAFGKLQLLVPGETAAPGTASGKTGIPAVQNADNLFSVTVNAVDANWNLVSTIVDTVGITASDVNAALPANAALSGGTLTFSVRLRTAGTATVTADDTTDGSRSANTSPGILVNGGAFAKLQVLLPGETAAPGTSLGKTGTPTAQMAGTAFAVTVQAVDANWNLINTNDTVAISSSDAKVTLPANAALVAGTGALSVTFKTSGSQTVTASDVTHTGIDSATSSAAIVSAAAANQLVIATSPSATATAGVSFAQQPVIQIEDQYGNLRSNDTLVVTATRGAGAGTLLGTTNVTAVSGVASFGDLAHIYATNITIQFTSGALTPATSSTIAVSSGAYSELLVVLPGEISAPATLTGRNGSPLPQAAGTAFSVEISAVDAYWNLVNTVTNLVGLSSSDATAVLSTNALVDGTNSFSMRLDQSGTQTVTANDLIDGHTTGTSSAVTVSAGVFTRLQLLLPGETAAPGTPSGKTGMPSAQTAGVAYSVTVNAVDANWNLVNTNDTVSLTSGDPNAGLAANAALGGGTMTFSITNRTAGAWTVTASDVTHPGIAADSSSAVIVNAGALARLQLLAPGETAAPGTPLGKTGTPATQTVGTSYTVTVNAVDANWNVVSTNDTVAITSSDVNASLPANGALVAGSMVFNVMNKTAGSWTVTASNTTHAGVTADTSPPLSIAAGAFVKLQMLMPGETVAAGTPTGKTGTPNAQTSDTAFNVTVNAVDAYWNLLNTVTDTIHISSSDANAALPADAVLVAGNWTLSVTLKTKGIATLTAADATDGSKLACTSPSTSVNAGALAKLQLLLPGETAAPGTFSGKTGTPSTQTAGASYAVTVNAVDANWNAVSTNDTVTFTSTDANALLPPNTALVGGTKTLSVTNRTAGTWTLTASDTTHLGVAAGTSASFSVNPGAFTALQLLVPGETAAPGTGLGKSGSPTAQNTDTAFNVTVNAVDANWNLVTSVSDAVGITSSDTNATLPANAVLSAGTQAFGVKLNTTGIRTVTATDITDGSKAAITSPSITVNSGAFVKLQLLMPGETAAPGTAVGKTGSPTAQTAGASFSVIVKAVDASWNLISTNDTVQITSSDAQATLPGNAALSGGGGTFSVALKTSGSQMVTASDVTHLAVGFATSDATTVSAAVASRLVIATPPSAAATAGVSFAQQPVVWIEDQYGNLRSNDTLVVTAMRSSGTGSLLGTTNIAAVGGVATFTNLAHAVATNITIQFASGTLTAATSGTIAVSPGSALSQLLVLLPGETAAPGTLTGRTGTPTAQTLGTAFTINISAIDAYWNVIDTVTDLVSISSSDAAAILPGTAALINGTNSFAVTFKGAGSQTVAAADTTDGHTTGTSSAVTANPGPFTKLQLLVPGETTAPWTTTGKTGTPTAQVAGTAFTVTVNSVDANWNLVVTNDTIKITSSDSSATLSANAALVGGTESLSVTLDMAGTSTITASNVTHAAIAASTSPSITVYGVAPAAQSQPLVAIHDSELTRALETLPATGSTPSGTGTTGFQWWPTNWHYFVMPESVKEALRSDGTAYEVVGDADISSGHLMAANGQPRCPILISLASEAIRDDEIAQLTNYVAAGGNLLVGSSAFTRHIDGTPRGDFALAAQMGVHMVNASLTNWGVNNTFTKVADDSLIGHIPTGTLTWRLPTAAEEISWGISPAHPFLAAHSAWQVQSSNATVLARGDVYPYLVTKQFGKGRFIYLASMQPLIGFNSFSPTMYSYVIFRKAIELAFASTKTPVPKISPWPYAYDAAFVVRRDLENFTNEIAGIAASAQIDYTNGATGDYYFCTGTLREDAAGVYSTNNIIGGLRQAVTNYGAGIYPHNGGLKNPNNPLLTHSDFDYWHWGPDEALDATPTNYPNGKIYALTSISNSFHDMEFWLSGLTNGLRGWSGCYFNASREDSYDIQAQLGVNMAGDQKLSPFPHWTFSTRTAGKHYAFLSQPVSDWFVGGLVAQSLEPWHPPGVQTTQTLHDGIDYYYNLGALLNFYSHTLSTGLGDAGSLPLDYITYSLNTNRHPRLWSANAVKVYQWWLQRSNAQIIATYSTNGIQSIATFSIAGASDPRTAVEMIVPQGAFFGLQVFTNGTAASGGSYRTAGQLIKLIVGASVTNAEIRYTLTPMALNDLYYVTQGSTLAAPSPGVLSNDLTSLSGSLTAVLVSGPSHGTLTLSSNGGFSYIPATNFSGVDSFGYQANDGVTNSTTAIVTICVAPYGQLFSDNFTRSGTADPLAPWQVASGTSAITNGLLQSSGALQSYSFAYVTNAWTDYWVQGRFQFPAGAFGGGLGGRLNPLTGAHYAAWIYPEGSSGGSSVLKLIKFQNWTSFGYNNSSYTPMQQVSLVGVGTNWHTLKLAFLGNRIAVYFDGQQVLSAPDVESQTYSGGGITADMWTDAMGYTMSVDDVVASPLVLGDSYSVNENTTLSVTAPGLLANDTGVYGTNLVALLLNGPTNGTITWHANGAFSYSPTTNFAGADSFLYEASDGVSNLGTAIVSIAVSPAIIVTPDNLSRAYGAANPLLTGSIVGLQNGDNITAVYSTAANTNSPLGSYPINVGLLDPDHKLSNYTITTNNGTLSVTTAVLTVAANNASRAYGATNPVFTGILMGVQNGDNISASYASTATVVSPVGSYPITPTLADPSGKLSNYTVSSTNGSLNVTAAGLTVTANNASRAYGATNPALTGTITGLQNGDNISAVYATAADTNSPVGTYPITPTLADPSGKLSNYSVSSTNGTLQVTPATLTGTADAKSRLYGATNPPFTVTYTGFVNGQNTSVVTGTLSGSTPATTNSPAGSYPISVSGQSAPNYTIQYVDGILTVGAAPLLVTGDNASRAYGQTNPPFSATISGWVNGEDTNVLGGTLALTSPAQTNSPVGSYPIIPSGLTSTNYALSFSNGTLSVTAYALSVTANNASRAYGATNPALTGTITGLQNGDNISAVYATAADTNSPVGTYPITPTLADPSGKLSNYTVTTNSGTLSVTAAGLTVAANNASRVYGATNPVFTGTLTGVQNGDNITASYGSTAMIASTVGSYPITPTLADPSGKLSNYTVSTTNGTLSVTAAGLTVAANNASRVYGATNLVFTGTLTGVQNGDNISAVYATAADTNSPVGTYPITPSLADPSGKLSNYSVSTTNGTLQVTPATLTGTADAKSRLYGATNPPFTVTYTGFVNGQTAALVTGTLSGSTPATTNSPVGAYPISVSGQSAPNYTIQYVDGMLTVAAAPLLVTGDNASRAYGQTNPPFSATISGWVNGEDTNVLGGTLALTSPAQTNSPVGAYPIIPSGLTSTNYALTYSNGTLSVTAYALSVTANNASRAYGATNPVFSGTLTGVQNGDNISAVYATAADTNSPVGTYPITLSLLDPGHNLTNYSVTTNNGTLSVNPALLTVSADPQTKLYGQPDPALTYRITSGGLVNGNSLSGALSRVAGENVAAYAILQGTLAASTNYALTYSGTNLTIQPHWLFVQAYGQSRMYGTTNPVFTIYYVGFVGSDGVTNLTEIPQASTVAQTNSPVGDYDITLTGGSASNYTLIPSTGTLTVTAADLRVAANNASRAYGVTNPVFTGTLTGVQNGDNITATYASTATVTSPVGTYPITPSLADPSGKLSNYSVSTTNGNLSVTVAGLTVAANNASRVYGATNPVFTGTLAGVQNGDNITATYASTATVTSPVGTYPITPTLADPSGKLSNYTVSTTNGTLSVTVAGLTVAANNASRVYGATNPVFTGTITGLQNGDNITATYASTATVTSPVGTYPITPTLADPSGKLSNYAVSTTNGTLNVTAAGLTVAANNASRVYGATNPVFTGTLTGVQNGDNITASYASTATVTSPVGTYPITPTLADPSGKLSNYSVSTTNGTLQVTAATLTGTADAKSRLYGATNPPFTVTYTGFVNGQNTSVVTGTLSGSTPATTNSPVGSYPISVSGQSAPNYTLQYVDGILTVGAAPLLVTGDNVSRAYGQTNPPFSATISGWVNGEDTNVLGGTLALTSPAQTNSPVGSYPIIPSGLTSTNYALSFSNGSLSVTAYALSVTANNASRAYGVTNPVFTGILMGVQNGDNITATYASTATVTSPVGTYPITPTLADPSGKLSNYSVSTTNGNLSVTVAGLTVAANNASRAYGATNPVFTGTLTGVQNGDNITASYASTATVTSTVGTYPITPSLADPSGKLSNYSISSANGTLSVTTAGLAVTAHNSSRAYGTTNPTLTGTITGLENGDNITAVYATAADTNSPVGTYPITPTLADPSGKLSNYSVSTTNGTLQVTAATLTGTADAKSRLYGATNPPFTVTYTGFVNGQNTSVVTGTLSGSTPATTNSPVGSYPISVSGQSAPNYTLQYVDGILTVGAAPLLVTGDNVSRAYGQTNPPFSATISGWVNGEDTNVLGGTLALTSPAQTNSPVGSYPIIPSGLTSTNYALSFSNGSLSVTAYALSVTANNASRAYGVTNPVFTGILMGVQNGDNITATYASTATVTSPVGTYPITPTLADPSGKLSNYSVSTTNGNLSVTVAGLTVAANNASRVYGATNPVFTGTLTGVQNGDNITASYASTATVASPVGTYPITPTLADPSGKLSNYAVSTTNGTLNVTAAGLTVAANNASRVYGATNPVFTGTLTGVQNGDNITASYASTATVTSPVGTYPITPTLADPSGKLSNYSVSTTNGTLQVTAATLTGTADAKSRLYGATNPPFTVTYTGFVNGQNTSVVTGTLSGSTPATTNSPVGSYPISVSGQSAPNYTLQYVDGILTVGAAPLLVTGDNVSRAYGQTNPPFSATISGWVNGEDTNVLGGTLALTSPAQTNSPVGSYPIIPSGLTSTNYALSFSNGSLSVTAYALSVTANNASRAYGVTNPVFTGILMGVQNGDNITATYASTATVTSPVGTYPITPTLADPSGKLSNYSVSTTNGNLSVTVAGLTVAANNASRAYGATNPVFTGTLTGVQNGDNITASYASTATVTSTVGTYPITPSLADPSGKLSNYSISSANGTLSVTTAGLAVTAHNSSRAYGTTNPTLTGTITGLENGDNITAVYATAADTNSPVGTYPITPTLADPSGKLSNYSVSTTNGTLQVTAATLTGTADAKSRLYGATNPPFTVTYTGFVNGQNTSVVTGTLSGSTPATTNSPVGSYPISVSGQSAPNYTLQYVDGILTVGAAPLLVTGDNVSRAYGQTNPPFSATISGWVNGEDTNVLGGTLALTSPAQTNSPVGSYPIIPSGLTSTNYALSFSNGSLSVTAYALSVTANNASRAYGVTNPVFTGILMGVQNGDNITATYASTATVTSPVGTYPITPSLADPSGKLSNYSVSTTNGNLSVTVAGLTVAANNASRVYGATNPVFTGILMGVQNGDNISASYASTATVVSPVGSYPITPTLADPSGKLSNYTVSTTNGTLSVTVAGLTVAANNASRAYGVTNPVFTGILMGVQNGDNITASYASTTTVTSPVGTYPITPSLADPSGKLSNYSVSTTNGTLNVTAAGLTVAANSASRAYGATNPVFTGTLTGVQNGDNITATYASTATVTSTVGTYPITPTLADPSGKLSNYTVSTTNGTLSVTVAGLTVAANNASRAYGVTNPVFTGILMGVQNGDKITASYASTATVTSTVGNYPITPTLADPSGKLSNYAVSTTNGTLSVTAAGLTVAANNASRAYGTTNPVFTGTLTGVQNGDNITASYASTATVTSPVGTYPITPSLADPSGKLSNYTVSTTNGTLSVTAAGLTVAANNASRPYGAPNPVFTGTLTGVQNGDNISATYSTAATSTSPVGTYGIVPSVVDPGNKLPNYTVTLNNGLLTVTATTTPVILSILPAGKTNVVITWTTISNSVYRVQYKADLANTNWINLAPDVVATSGTASFTNYQAAGSQRFYRVLYVSSAPPVAPVIKSIVGGGTPNVVITWSAMSNRVYRVQYKPDLASANWLNLAPDVTATGSTASFTDHPGTTSQRLYRVVLLSTVTPLTPMVVVANNTARAYGSTNPVLGGTITGVQSGDNITATYATSATASSPTGTYAITPSLVDPSGKLDNYIVTITNGSLTVTAAALNATASSASRAYGTTNPVFTGTLAGVQNGDNITATYASTATVTSTVGTYPITSTLVDPSGKLSNYTVSITNASLTVTAAALKVTANNASRAYGVTNPIFTGTLTGVQNGDNITATYASTATVASTVGTYPITPTLADPSGKLSNYVVNTTNGTLSVTAVALKVVASNAFRVYGATNPIFGGTLTGVQNGDNITANYASTATVTSTVGTYPITPTLVDPSGKLSNYSVSITNGTLGVTAAALTVTANNTSRFYGAANPTFTGTIAGIRNGDNITATYASAASQTSTVGTYPITPTLVDPSGKLSNYTVSITNGTLTVSAAALTATASNTSRAYGATNPVFTGTLTGVQNGDNITATYASTATVASTVGSYPITPTLADPSGKLSNYSVSITNGALSVTAAALTVTANNTSRAYGAANPAFTGTVSGIRNSDNITATYASTATPASTVGSYPITPTLVDPSGKLSNYSVSITNGTLTVSAAALAVSASNASRPGGTANPAFTGTITGIQNNDNITATYTTTATINSPAGTYPIVPSLVDPGNKLPNYTITVNNGTLTVTTVITPTILSIAPSSKTNIVVTWRSVSNSVYRVQYRANLASTNWISLTPDVTAASTTASYTDTPAGAQQRYYRVVLLSGVSAQTLLYEYFSRPTDPGPLSPWVAQFGVWSVTGGALKGGADPLQSYGDIYIATNWTDYSVQAQIQLPAGAFGGGLGGRLNPVTGAHYAAWIYPEGSPGGSKVLKLVKYQSWTTFGYTNVSGAPMQQVTLTAVSTNWHTLKLAFQGNQISVSFDGNQLISATDLEATPYTSGGVSADMWTENTPFPMAVANVLVNSLATSITPSTLGIKGNGSSPYSITFSGTVGSQYLVQAATNLAPPVAWVTVSTNTAGSNGQWTFTDPTTNRVMRFYRAAKP